MSDALDLQEAILAELRNARSALSTCIVVTAIADDAMRAGATGNIAAKHFGVHRIATDARADQIAAQRDLDGYSGLLLAVRQSMGETSDVGAASRTVDAKSAMANAIKQVLLSLAGRSSGGQKRGAPTKKSRAKGGKTQRQTSTTAV